jgi:nucleotide-binding universal stress UspA family protein
MRFSKKVVVGIGLGSEMSELIKPIRDMEFLAHSEIHFVHVFNSTSFTTVFGDFPVIYPVAVAVDPKAIEESVQAFLTRLSIEVLPKDFAGKVVTKCLFDNSPKDKFCDYVNENRVDLVIIPTRQKRGLFESSFAQFVNKHTHANMLLLKNI